MTLRQCSHSSVSLATKGYSTAQYVKTDTVNEDPKKKGKSVCLLPGNRCLQRTRPEETAVSTWSDSQTTARSLGLQ